ncbi:unnamed protein product [Linum trigynum]|uniref:Uncharacterized protein n=1 Tax=Linum trigynum TaxID=586398 RepID=A0AAV2DA32_9ROSI
MVYVSKMVKDGIEGVRGACISNPMGIKGKVKAQDGNRGFRVHKVHDDDARRCKCSGLHKSILIQVNQLEVKFEELEEELDEHLVSSEFEGSQLEESSISVTEGA